MGGKKKTGQKALNDRSATRDTIAAIRSSSFSVLSRLLDEQKSVCVVLAQADPRKRARVASGLRSLGYSISEMGDGIGLLEWLARALEQCSDGWRPDLVVADIHLHGWTGIDVLVSLRNAGWTTPFILLAEPGDRRLIETAERLGPVVVFDSPFEPEDVATAAPFVLARHRNDSDIDCLPDVD